VLPVLLDKRLVIVTGKGGVGKTTIATALALASARDGKRTLICEVNARERVTGLLGRPETGAEISSMEENLWAVDVRPHEAMREYALMILKFESIYNAVFENRLVRYFLRFVPSLQELVMLGKILFHLKEKRPDGGWRFERIIIDAPATGHAITFFSVPKVILDTVPPGALATDAKWMHEFLIDPAMTAAVLVSLPEEMPVNETIELAAALRDRVQIRPQAVVLNGFIADRFSPAELGQLPTPELQNLARVHQARAHLSVSAATRLNTLKLPVAIVPRLFTPTFGRTAIEELSRLLVAP
jgi:anion-transporting  ArsA/GET3 family ATPase